MRRTHQLHISIKKAMMHLLFHEHYLRQGGQGRMVLAVMMLLVTILCAWAVYRELKAKNAFAVVFAGISVLVFGFFSLATLFSPLF